MRRHAIVGPLAVLPVLQTQRRDVVVSVSRQAGREDDTWSWDPRVTWPPRPSASSLAGPAITPETCGNA